MKIAALLASILLTTATGCENEPDRPPETAAPDAGSSDAFVLPDFEGGTADFKIAHAIEEGYWYSRYNLGALAMKSGLGETFMPDMAMVQAMVDMVSDSASTATRPMNPALLKRVYDGGNPAYVAAHDSDPMDFGDERWQGSSPAPTTGAAFGWLVVKEVEWAKQFHVDSHFGEVGKNDIPGAEERFAGLVLYAEAVMQAMELANAPAAFELTRPEDGYATLLALSDLALVTAPDALPHSSTNRYKMAAGMMAGAMGMAGADMASMFSAKADAMYAGLPAPVTARDHGLAIEALAFYGAASATNRAAVKQRIAEYADWLAASSPDGTLARASVVQGLATASRAVGPRASWGAALAGSFTGLVAAYDGRLAVFGDLTTYSVEDVAVILRALNAASLLASGIDKPTALHVLRDFFENVVDVSGLQIASPPLTEIASYERLGELFHRYPTTPVPTDAGGAFGVAPVLAASVSYDATAHTWTADRTRFDTAGSMHLSNEMLWLHADEVDGFPVVP